VQRCPIAWWADWTLVKLAGNRGTMHGSLSRARMKRGSFFLPQESCLAITLLLEPSQSMQQTQRFCWTICQHQIIASSQVLPPNAYMDTSLKMPARTEPTHALHLSTPNTLLYSSLLRASALSLSLFAFSWHTSHSSGPFRGLPGKFTPHVALLPLSSLLRALNRSHTSMGPLLPRSRRPSSHLPQFSLLQSSLW